MFLSDLDELTDILDTLVFEDESSIFTEEYAIDLVQTALHLMDEFIIDNPQIISETDFQNLANLATTYVKKSDLRITSGNTSNNGYVISATGCQASTTASGNPCTIVPWNTYKTTTFS